MCRDSCNKKDDVDICSFNIGYGDGTKFQGEIYEDEIRLSEGGESFRSQFGCISDEENSYYVSTENGIMGLSHYRENILHPWFSK